MPVLNFMCICVYRHINMFTGASVLMLGDNFKCHLQEMYLLLVVGHPFGSELTNDTGLLDEQAPVTFSLLG